MAKYLERIALEQYNYVEVKADGVDELVKAADAVRESSAYKDRLHKPAEPKVEGTNFSKGVTASKCAQCGGDMVYREGVSKKNGKEWKAYFCQDKNCGNVSWVR